MIDAPGGMHNPAGSGKIGGGKKLPPQAVETGENKRHHSRRVHHAVPQEIEKEGSGDIPEEGDK